MKLLIIIMVMACGVFARPQDFEDTYGEEYYYQEYDEDDLGFYNYNEVYPDYGAAREPQPDPTTTTTTTTTRRPYYPSTTRRPRRTTTTAKPSMIFKPARASNTRRRQEAAAPTTPSPIDLSKTTEPGLETTTAAFAKPDGDEYGNKLVYLGYRKEDYYCPEGYVLDIYGYCRAIFYEERRDWRWWTDIRNFVLGVHNSGYQSSY